MPVTCECATCKAKYQVGDQYAGRTIQCPKCSAAVAVPAIAQPKSQAAEDAATDDQDAGDAPPADDGLGFLAEELVKPKRRPVPAVAKQSFAEDEPGGDAEGDLAAIAGLAGRSPKGIAPHRSKKKKPGLPAWMVATIAAVGVAVVAGIVTAIYLVSTMKTGSGTNAVSSTLTGGKNSDKPSGPERKVPVLRIKWPENQRGDAVLLVNDEKKELPLKGSSVEVRLPPSNERYKIRLRRKGFQEQTFFVASHEDDLEHTVTEWEPLASTRIDWEQDFRAAKKTADREHKNVLILFDASDAKASSFGSSRFREAVALRPEFRERADKEYVCVYIDNPQHAEAQEEVKDADRNRELTEKFHVAIFPTVLATDPRGRPFGVLEDYKINGINAFLELMDKWTSDGKRLFPLLARFDAMPKDSPNPSLAGEVLDVLEMSKLGRFYAPTIDKATACLPRVKVVP